MKEKEKSVKENGKKSPWLLQVVLCLGKFVAVPSGTELGVTACRKHINQKPLPMYFGGVGEIAIN